MTQTVSDLPDREDWLSLAYDFRDQILPSLPEGAWMRDAFYKHGPEVTRQIMSEPDLRNQALELLGSVGPALRSALSEGRLKLGVQERLAIISFALTLRRDGSDALKKDLTRFLGLLSASR